MRRLSEVGALSRRAARVSSLAREYRERQSPTPALAAADEACAAELEAAARAMWAAVEAQIEGRARLELMAARSPHESYRVRGRATARAR